MTNAPRIIRVETSWSDFFSAHSRPVRASLVEAINYVLTVGQSRHNVTTSARPTRYTVRAYSLQPDGQRGEEATISASTPSAKGLAAAVIKHLKQRDILCVKASYALADGKTLDIRFYNAFVH